MSDKIPDAAYFRALRAHEVLERYKRATRCIDAMFIIARHTRPDGNAVLDGNDPWSIEYAAALKETLDLIELGVRALEEVSNSIERDIDEEEELPW